MFPASLNDLLLQMSSGTRAEFIAYARTTEFPNSEFEEQLNNSSLLQEAAELLLATEAEPLLDAILAASTNKNSQLI